MHNSTDRYCFEEAEVKYPDNPTFCVILYDVYTDKLCFFSMIEITEYNEIINIL